MQSKLITASAAALLITSVTANAVDIKVGRYTLTKPVATPQQQDPLSVLIDVTFTKDIVTVGHALNHILTRSGYYLASGKVADPTLPILLNSSLPEIHRRLGPLSLRNGLKTLAGSAWVFVEDPVNRLVSFELKKEYRNMGGE